SGIDWDLPGDDDHITVTDAYYAHVDGQEGDDTIAVGEINDAYDWAWSSSVDDASVEGGAGNDSIVVIVSDDASVDGEGGNDTITVWADNNADVWGGSGDDVISVITDDGDIYVDGEDGDDEITVNAGGNDDDAWDD